MDSGNSSSCCRSPSPEVLSPKRQRTSLAPPKKRFKEDPTLNLLLSDIKDSVNSNKLQPKFTNTKKINNPFRPWGNGEEEEEINDDEDDCFVDVERQSPSIPTSQHLRNSRFYEESLSNASSSSSSSSPPVGNTSNFIGGSIHSSILAPSIPPSTIPPLPITPQLITANHQQLVQASQNLLTLSKLYPSLVDMNALASVAAAAQLAASTAAAAASTPSIIAPLQPNIMNQSPPILSQHRPHLADIQDQYSGGTRQRVEPEQEEPLALIKKPSKAEMSEKSVPMNYMLAKKMASLKENHQPFLMTTSDDINETSDSSVKKGNKKSTGNTEKTTQQQRNYKNMTRERRVEANARERQRVHTITAAFDTLQSLIPSPEDVDTNNSKSPSSSSSSDVDSSSCINNNNLLSNLNNQKLSKLSIIKIATSYIMLLSRMAGYDYSEDKSAPSIEECVKKCSELLTQETKVKRSRDTLIKVENN